MTLKYIWRSFSLGCHFHVHFSYPWHAFASHGLPAIAELLVPKPLGIFRPNFSYLLCVPIYARLRIFIQLSATLTKLCHIMCDHPVHIMCAKCPPSAETHSGIVWHFSQTWIFSPNLTRLLNVHMYARMQIFIQLSPTVTKLCHIKCDPPSMRFGRWWTFWAHYGGRA